MADFCFQCSLDMYFGPPGDFADPDCQTGFRRVLCEGCGVTMVNRSGVCVGSCDLDHDIPSERQREVLRRAERWLARRSGPLGRLYRLRDRLLGTPWEPGLWHQWRFSYHSWLEDRKRDINNSDFTFTDGFDDYAGPQRREAGETSDRIAEGEEPGKDGPDPTGISGGKA